MIKLVYVLEKMDFTGDSIFLSGPTYRVNDDTQISEISWREDVVKLLAEKEFDGTIFIPEYRNNVKPENWTYSRQIDWELEFLKKSTVILFWIPRNLEKLPGFTTNIEFGEWLNSGKIVVGSPLESPKNEYLKERCVRLNLNWYYSIEDVVQASLKKLFGLIIPESKTWYTADTHFGEERTRVLSKRPFNNVDEMDWEIVKRWNEKVGDNDTVCHLGDFGNPNMLKYLKGNKIVFLPGNYDSEEIQNKLCLDKRISLIENNYIGKTHNEQFFLMVHAPEDGKIKDDIKFFLFGHIHKLGMIKKNGLNVGVDCHNYYPIDEETVLFYKNAIEKHYDKNVFMDKLGYEIPTGYTGITG